MNFKGKDCISHVLQCLAGIHERVDNSCKRRAEYPRRSFIIVHTERSQRQAPFIREKSEYLAEVGVTEQILRKFPNSLKSWGELSMRKQCVPGSFFSTHGLEPGNEARSCIDVVACVKPLASYPGSTQLIIACSMVKHGSLLSFLA